MREGRPSDSQMADWKAPCPEKAEGSDSVQKREEQATAEPARLDGGRVEAKPAKKTPERAPKTEAKESKERLTIRSFEYRDAEGKVLGKAIAGFSPKEETVGGRRALELKTLKLQGFKGGKPTTVDILEKMNPFGVKIMMQVPGQEGRDERYYDSRDDVVMTSMPDDFISLGTLGHELGHASQAREERFKGLENADGVSRRSDFYNLEDPPWDRMGPAARQVLERVPEAAKALGVTAELLDDMDRLHSDISATKTRVEELKQLETAASEAADPGTIERYRQEREAAEADLKVKQEKMNKVTLLSNTRELIATAKQILERDATRRSLQWMREMKRESGVNLFAETAHKSDPEGGDCEDSMSEGMAGGSEETADWEVTDYISHARSKLGTYGADRYRVGKTETSPGVTPMPGGDRVEAKAEDSTLTWVRSNPESASPPVSESSVGTTPSTEAPLFSPEALQPTPPKPKKKGFFARLFGR